MSNETDKNSRSALDIRNYPLLGTAIIAVFASLMIAKYVFSDKALNIDFPSHMAITPQNDLAIRVGDRLYIGDQQGEKRVVDLNKFHASAVLGGFDFFANGDLLIRKGNRERSFSDNILAFFRLEPPINLEPTINKDLVAQGVHNSGGEGALQRCSFALAKCTKLANEDFPRFFRTFWLALDKKDRVFISDTSRHRLIGVDENLKTVFYDSYNIKFPNQLVIQDQLLWYANTNRHKLNAIEITDAGLGAPMKSFDVNTERTNLKYRFPVAFARISSHWWVLVKDTHLEAGEIRIFNQDGTYEKSIQVPDGSDFMYILAYQNDVIALDMEKYNVVRFDTNGEQISFFNWPQLASHLSKSKQSSARYSLLSRIASLLISLFIFLAFNLIFLWLKRIYRLQPRTMLNSEINLRNDGIIWIPLRKKLYRLIARVLFISAVFFVAALFVYLYFSGAIESSDAIAFVGILFLLVGGVFILPSSNTRIGVLNDVLIVVENKKRWAAVKAADVLYSPGHIMVGDISISLGSASHETFSYEKLVKHVFPLLKNARHLERAQMLERQFANQHYIFGFAFSIFFALIFIEIV